MRLINPESKTTLLPEMDVLSMPQSQVGALRSKYKKVQLKNGLKSDQGPFLFDLASGSRDFICLKRSWIVFDFKMLDEGNNVVPESIKVPSIGADGKPDKNKLVDKDYYNAAPIEGIGGTIIKSVELKINGVLIESSNLAAYRFYLENKLNYSDEAKAGSLSVSGYSGEKEIFDKENSPAHLARLKMVGGRKSVQVACRLPLNLASVAKLLPASQLDISLTVYLNNQKFIIEQFTTAAKDYKIKLNDMYCLVDEWEVSDGYASAVEKQLLTNGLYYPLNNVQMRSFYIEKDRSHSHHMSVFNGNMPKRITMGLVSQAAFDGDFTKSPFNFKHYDIQDIQINAGGIQYPGRPLNLDWENGKYSEAFLHTLESIGYARQNLTNSITMGSFKKGNAIFSFELSPTVHDPDMMDLLGQNLNLSIHLTFKKALPEGVYLIVMGETDSMLYIDQNRNPRINSV